MPAFVDTETEAQKGVKWPRYGGSEEWGPDWLRFVWF